MENDLLYLFIFSMEKKKHEMKFSSQFFLPEILYLFYSRSFKVAHGSCGLSPRVNAQDQPLIVKLLLVRALGSPSIKNNRCHVNNCSRANVHSREFMFSAFYVTMGHFLSLIINKISSCALTFVLFLTFCYSPRSSSLWNTIFKMSVVKQSLEHFFFFLLACVVRIRKLKHFAFLTISKELFLSKFPKNSFSRHYLRLKRKKNQLNSVIFGSSS